MDLLPPQQTLPVLLFLVAFSILILLAKTSAVVANDVWIKQKAEENDKRAKRIYSMLSGNSSNTMDCLEFAMHFCIISISTITVFVLFEPFCLWISSMFIDVGVFVVHTLSLILCVVVTSLVYTIFVIFIPKRIASKNPEKILIFLSLFTKVVCCVFRPFLSFNYSVARVISMIFGVRDEDINDDEVTEEEIRMMVDIGSESGTIDDDEKQMIHNIFEMDDKPVGEIMTHRTEVSILWAEDGIEEWRKIIDETNHTRYPVCGESIDDVLGVIRSRDFYRLLLSGKMDAMSILRSAWFIPDTIKADELFSKMQRENEHMGIVMDEYGGFQGIVTQEDLIEEIVGELYDEYDEPEIEEKDIVQIDENTWEILGSAEIDEVEEALSVKIEDGDYNTFAGFILNELQTIPADGQIVEFEANNMLVKVTSVIEHRIEKAQVIVLRDSGETAEEDAENVIVEE